MIYGNTFLPKEYIAINEINMKISEFPILYEIAQTPEEKKNIISRLFSNIRKLISKAAEIFKEKWNNFITKIKMKLKSFSKMNLKKKFLHKFKKEGYIEEDKDFFDDDNWETENIEFTKPIEVSYKDFSPLLKEWLSCMNNGKNIVDYGMEGLEDVHNFYMDPDNNGIGKSASISAQDIFKPLPKGLSNIHVFIYNTNELTDWLSDYANYEIQRERDMYYTDCRNTRDLDKFLNDYYDSFSNFVNIYEKADSIYINSLKLLTNKYNEVEQYANEYLIKSKKEDDMGKVTNVHRAMQEPLNMCIKILNIVYNTMIRPINTEANIQYDNLTDYHKKLKGIDNN